MAYTGLRFWSRTVATLGIAVCVAVGSASVAKAFAAKRAGVTVRLATTREAPAAHDTAPTLSAPAPAVTPEIPSLPLTATKLRRVRGNELSVRLVQIAGEIVREHHAEPFGTEIAFELDGKQYVGRIEQHYHPPGGELRPWGFHPGCSLLVREP